MGTWHVVAVSVSIATSGCIMADIGEGEDAVLEDIELAADNGIFLDNGLNLANGMNLGNGTVLANGMNLGNGVDLANGMNLGNGLNLGNGITGPYYAPPAGSGLEQWIDVDPAMRKRILRYLVECALPPGVEVQLSYRGRLEVLGHGVAGLGLDLQYGAMRVSGQERVTACMLARMNGTGRTVQIDLFGPMGPDFETTVPADEDFPVVEAAFFGNLFKIPATAQACPASPFPLELMRSCRDLGDGNADCGVIEFTTDLCWEYVTAQCDVALTTGFSQRPYYTNCYGGEVSWQYIITTYIAPRPAGSPCGNTFECESGVCLPDGVCR